MLRLTLSLLSLFVGLVLSGLLIPGYVSGAHPIVPVVPMFFMIPCVIVFFIGAVKELTDDPNNR